MAPMQRLLAFLLLSWLVPCAAAQGLLPRWEVESMAKSLEEHAASVEQVLEQVRPKEWIQAGASNAYVDQYEALRSDLTNLGLSAQNLVRHPEKISVVVDTFLWLERSGSMLQSLTEGVRRYQNAALADILSSAVARNRGAENQLKQYMRELAVEREAQLEIAHDEAQRCRGELVKGKR